MDNQPLISVIVPVYKVEAFLRPCVDSILAQTFSDFELILVDDGSPDNCGAICDEYAAKDSRVHVIHQQNGGLSAARNAGIDWCFANSNSQWLSFVDSDDTIRPDYLAKLYSTAADCGADLCVCDFQTTLPDGTIEYGEASLPQLIAEGPAMLEQGSIFSNWRYVISCCKLYQKQLFHALRFPEGFIHEDEAVIHRILGASKTVAVIPDRLYCYHRRAGSITGSEKSVKNTDYLFALSDRILFANQKHLLRCLAASIRAYHRFLLYIALPLLVSADKNDPHIRRSVQATRAVLPLLLKSRLFSLREKVRVACFCLFPGRYLSISRFRSKNTSGDK